MGIIKFFRNTLSGTYYVIYTLVLLILMFAMIGYLFKQKYGKLEFKISTSAVTKEVVADAKNGKTTKTKEKKKKPKAKSAKGTQA